MTALVTQLAPRRGSLDADGLPVSTPDKPQTLFVQVERTRDQVSGMHLITYQLGYEVLIDADNPVTCTASGGIGGGAGANIVVAQLPPVSRITDAIFETVTALVNDAATEDIDRVQVATTDLFIDTDLTAAAGIFRPATRPLLKNTGAVALTVYLAGADTVVYTAGKFRIYLDVLSSFES